MSYVPYKAASFLGPINEVHHLFAVMNNPCAAAQCLLINITSVKPGKYHDPACELDVGDHAFIKHPSYALYRLAETMRADRISKLVNLNYYLTKDDWDPVIFQRIVDGIRNSDDTKPRVIKYADENLIV
ncbi:hypothetical protein GR210_29810 [Rhizobium leguminosarum]|uniref:hypothetical protein n=1 Tax=Rhizobium leguminosarum TaxID=384 RepID=UPI0013DA2318|nr:hypothetical protein [Rhizobium leguminosarum]NEH52970.1 hypothetical protein [Rhizobium leguminosarum]